MPVQPGFDLLNYYRSWQQQIFLNMILQRFLMQVEMRFGIVVSDWNSEITFALLDGAIKTLQKHGTLPENILVKHVPGSFELTLGAQFIAENEDVDAVICLGCVIQGETPHFTYICQGVTKGITQLNIDYNIPFIFGVLTTENHATGSGQGRRQTREQR